MYSYVQDPYFRRLNASMLHSRSSEGLQMGTWVQLGEDPIEADEVGFFIDIGRGPASVLPDDLSGETKDWWVVLRIYELKDIYYFWGLQVVPDIKSLYRVQSKVSAWGTRRSFNLWLV